MTVKQPVVSQGEKEPLPVTSSISFGKAESSDSSRLHEEDSVRHQKEVEPSSLISLPQSKPGLGTSVASAATSSTNLESDVHTTSASASSLKDSTAPSSTSSADEARNVVVVPDSIKDKPKEPGVSIKDKPNEPGDRGKQDQVCYGLFIRYNPIVISATLNN